MLDRFIDGQVERILEAPVPVLSKTTNHGYVAAVANVARNLCHLASKLFSQMTAKMMLGALWLRSFPCRLPQQQPVMDKARLHHDQNKICVQQILCG